MWIALLALGIPEQPRHVEEMWAWQANAVQKKTLRLTVATIVGLVSCAVPVPGMLGAAVVFPEGIEGDHGIVWLVLSLCLNFALFFGIAYLIFGLFSKSNNSN